MARMNTCVALAMAAVAVLGGCIDNDTEEPVDKPRPATAQDALTDMKALFRDLAGLVGTIRTEGVDTGASLCTPPLEHLVSFDWALWVDVTSASTGAEALDAIQQELEARGFTLYRDAKDDEVESLRGNDGLMIMVVRASKTEPVLMIDGSSACAAGEEYEDAAVP